ncbi:hypothetical protein, partial [Pseudomonas sp.]|uniref:hypothetical protein n=1 Tax=Pseudomonas sp. TaxID=306 RepID=UPI003F97186B
LRALVASWQQQNQASDFLTSGGADESILALAIPDWQGERWLNRYGVAKVLRQGLQTLSRIHIRKKQWNPWNLPKLQGARLD